jgi:hypothetical protein
MSLDNALMVIVRVSKGDPLAQAMNRILVEHFTCASDLPTSTSAGHEPVPRPQSRHFNYARLQDQCALVQIL